uniref:Putative secreted protein n=1 Tax=Anopheles darlingi TaxID=43151 RepID=A0A2M4DKM3_ANODA
MGKSKPKKHTAPRTALHRLLLLVVTVVTTRFSVSVVVGVGIYAPPSGFSLFLSHSAGAAAGGINGNPRCHHAAPLFHTEPCWFTVCSLAQLSEYYCF